MTGSLPVASRRQAAVGVALGFYAASVALVPGLGAKAAFSAPLVAIPLVWWILGGPNRWLSLFLLSALLLPPLPVAIGNSGPHVALLFAGAGLWLGLLRLSEWRLRLDALAVSLLMLFAIFFSSVAMAVIYSGLAIAAGSLARVLLLGISVYVFLYLRDGPSSVDSSRAFRPIRMLFWAAAASALFACVDFYFQFPAPAGYGPQFIWLDSGVFRRAQGVFYEASTLGNVCAFFLEMIAVALFRPRRARPMSLLALLTGGAALSTALVLSFSRASLLNLAVALVALFWLHRERIRFGRLLASVAIFGAAAAVILLTAFPVFTAAYGLRISSSMQYFFQSPNAVLSGRLGSWTLLRDYLLAHPWHALLGIGYKTLPYSGYIGTTAIADNTYLSSLVETGILGLAAVLALNLAILMAAYRASRAADPLRSFCGTWM
ncbi:MAG: O-antigen ligase family protein, partial [Pseudomonadota bacterium]